MTVLSYPFAWLPVVIVFGVPATIIVPFLAYVWLVVFVALAVAAMFALASGLVAASVAVLHRLSARGLDPGTRAETVPLARSSGRR